MASPQPAGFSSSGVFLGESAKTKAIQAKTTPGTSQLRHGKPSDAYRKALKAPTRADWNRLVLACAEAVINGSEDVLVAFAYTLKLPKDFPKGVLVKRDGYKNIRKIKANKLLTWLNEKGHTDISMETLRVAQMKFTRHVEGEITCGLLEALLDEAMTT